MVRRDTVLETVGPARVLPHITAQSRNLLAGRIRLIDESVLQYLVLQIQSNDTRLHSCRSVWIINIRDAVHAGEMDHNSTCNRNRPAGQVGAGAPAENGDLFFICQGHDF